jgi:hypothetical protein
MRSWPPSLFVNGRRHDGAFDVATLTSAVRAARTRALLEREAAQHAGALRPTA